METMYLPLPITFLLAVLRPAPRLEKCPPWEGNRALRGEGISPSPKKRDCKNGGCVAGGGWNVGADQRMFQMGEVQARSWILVKSLPTPLLIQVGMSLTQS